MAIQCLTGFENGKVPNNVNIIEGIPAVGVGRPFRQTQDSDAHRWALLSRKSRTLAAIPNIQTSANVTGGGTYEITQSSGTTGWQAFDGNEGTTWVSDTTVTGHVTVDYGLGNEKVLGGYRIRSIVTPGTRPATFAVLGSNDNFVTSKTLHYLTAAAAATYAAVPNPAGGAFGWTNLYHIASNEAFRYIRFQVYATEAGTVPPQLSEIEYHEVANADTNQATVAISVSPTPVPAVFGSFCAYATKPEFSTTITPEPIIEFSSVKVWLKGDQPTAKGINNITGGNNVLTVLKSLGWASVYDASAINSSASNGDFTGIGGYFDNMVLNIPSGVISLRKGKYYVALVGTSAITPSISSTSGDGFGGASLNEYVGVDVGTIETLQGSATLYEIDVLEDGNLDDSTTDPIKFGNSSETGNKWIPFKYDPRESYQYKLIIDDGNGNVISTDQVSIKKGRWAFIKFNIDVQSNGGDTNGLYVHITDTESSVELHADMSVNDVSSSQIILRGIKGDSSRLDDIRVEDTGVNGTPPAICRCESKTIGQTGPTTFVPTQTATNVNVGTHNFLYIVNAPDGTSWSITSTGIIIKILEDGFSTVSYTGAYSARNHAHLVYNVSTDTFFFITNGFLNEFDYKTGSIAMLSDANISIPAVPTSLTAPVGIYDADRECVFFITASSIIRARKLEEVTTWSIPSFTVSFFKRMYSCIHSKITDELVHVIGTVGTSQVGKFNITKAENGEAQSSYYKLENLGGFAGANVLPTRTIQWAANTMNPQLEVAIGCSQSNSSTGLYFGKLGALTNVVAVSQGPSDGSANTWGNELDVFYDTPVSYEGVMPKLAYIGDYNTLSAPITDNLGYVFGSPGISGYFVNPINGYRYVMGTYTMLLKVVNASAGKNLNELLYVDNNESYGGLSGDKIILHRPEICKSDIVRVLGRNIGLNSIRGAGSMSVKGFKNSTVNGINSVAKDIIVTDYTSSTPDPIPELAFYGDHALMPSSGSGAGGIAVNHGSNTNVITDIPGAVQSAASCSGMINAVPTYGTTAGFSILTTAIRAAHQCRILDSYVGAGDTMVTDRFLTYSSHGLANSSADFSINICFSARPPQTVKLSAARVVTLFSSNKDAIADDANTIRVHSRSTDAIDEFVVTYLGITSPAMVALSTKLNILTVGREAGYLKIMYNGVEIVNTNVGVSADVIYGPVSLFGDVNALNYWTGHILSWDLHRSVYTEWDYDPDYPSKYFTGPAITLTNG